ncbi:MAG: MFS transporter [Chloroflexi bacterium]|nr:MFS transporter [Chloroflexota bacterium]
MKRHYNWVDHVTTNIYWFGLNIASGTITPVLLPYLVALFAPVEQKNTYLATVRVIGLAVAMLVQPMAGMLSDRNLSRWGRRRPFIVGGTVFNLPFLLIVGASPLFLNSTFNSFFQPTFGVTTAYIVLLAGIVLLQISSNFVQGPLQALIPDVMPENQRGRSSGVKAVMELLPVFLVIFIGPLVDRGQFGLVVSVVGAGYLICMLITARFVHEEPLKERVTASLREPIARLVALTVLFVAVTQAAVWLVGTSGGLMKQQGAAIAMQVAVVGAAGLIGMAGAIFIGVYFGAGIGIGAEARGQTSFIWWVINRLLFLAAVGSIQGFAQFFMRDVLRLPNAATMTTVLLAVVALFLVPSALFGGYLADRIGRKRLVGLAGLVAAAGTFLLLLANDVPLVLVSGCIIGLGTGTFMASNWALGTDLVPPKQAGRYLGISNLAGAGAGIVGAGIGGPMADFFNFLSPGLGYLVIFAIYGALFLLSAAALTQVKTVVEMPTVTRDVKATV